MEQSELLELVCSVLKQQGLEYLIVGSQATIVYGEPRFTNDIDIVVNLDLARLNAFLEAFPADDFYVSVAAARDAIMQHGMFNIIHPSSGLKIDVIIPGNNDYERRRFDRGRSVKVGPDFEAVFASPEDVIIKKMEFFKIGGSDRHLRDIAGVIKISGEKIDRDYIATMAACFGLTEIWQGILNRLA